MALAHIISSEVSIFLKVMKKLHCSESKLSWIMSAC